MKQQFTTIIVLLFLSALLVANSPVNFNFETGHPGMKVKTGNAVTARQGQREGQQLKLQPQTSVSFDLKLQPSSTYSLIFWVRTESGADDLTLQINGLGKNNISVTTALATWTRFERTLNVSAGHHNAELEILFANSQGNTSAWVDDIEIKRIGNYTEKKYTGIPEAPKRIIETDLGIQMQPDHKIQWMLDDKLGMFIHWGIYAGPGRGEWYMENQGIKPELYRKLAYPESGENYFDAKDYDPRKWVDLARKSGMKYMNMVSMHHDGYALFESKAINAFTSKQTHNRDFVKEYVDACREAGLRVGLFKTLINWRYPGYYDVTGTDCKSNKFGYVTDPTNKESARLMKEELYCQVKELFTKYGPIDQLFWDGGWLAQRGSDADAAYFWESGQFMSKDNEWPVCPYFQDVDAETGMPLGLMGIARKYQPDMVVNPRSGWRGDYTVEEGGGDIRGDIRSGVVEKCVSLAPGWGYNKLMENPDRIMSLNRLKRLFADCVVRNMCFLVNVGPDRHGNIPPLIEKRLVEFGDWVNANNEAIFGTRGGPWNPVDSKYGFSYKENIIYVYLLGEYKEKSFEMPPVDKGMKVKRSYNVHTGESISARQKGQIITLNNVNPVHNDITIIAVELNRNIREENM
jgi:alpha-L-fucosidase